MAPIGGRTIKEKDIQKAILQWLSMQPRECIAWQNDSVGIYDPTKKTFRARPKGALAGVADILGIWRGLPLAIEVKRPGGIVSEAQEEFLERFEKHGGISIVAYSLDDVIRELKAVA